MLYHPGRRWNAISERVGTRCGNAAKYLRLWRPISHRLRRSRSTKVKRDLRARWDLTRQRRQTFASLAINFPLRSDKPIHLRCNAISERVGIQCGNAAKYLRLWRPTSHRLRRSRSTKVERDLRARWDLTRQRRQTFASLAINFPLRSEKPIHRSPPEKLRRPETNVPPRLPKNEAPEGFHLPALPTFTNSNYVQRYFVPAWKLTKSPFFRGMRYW
jgi:hypothetical protein